MENIVKSYTPSMFRNNPIGFIALMLITIVSIIVFLLSGMIWAVFVIFVWIYWWLLMKSTTLSITDKSSVLRRGILSKATWEIRHKDIKSIKIRQSFFQRIMGTGVLEISSASGNGEDDISISGLSKPYDIKILIDSYRE